MMVQQCLMAEKGLTCEKALELALVIESVEKDTKEIKIAQWEAFSSKRCVLVPHSP